MRSTLVELRNASTRTVWLGQRWFIVPSQLEQDWVRNAVRSIEAELGCVCWCDALVDEWSPVCTRASCPAGEAAPGRESYAPLAPDEVRELDWDGDLTDLDPAAKCRYAVGYPPGTELAASLCWYDADPNEDPSAELHCLSRVFHYGDSEISMVITGPDAVRTRMARWMTMTEAHRRSRSPLRPTQLHCRRPIESGRTRCSVERGLTGGWAPV